MNTIKNFDIAIRSINLFLQFEIIILSFTKFMTHRWKGSVHKLGWIPLHLKTM